MLCMIMMILHELTNVQNIRYYIIIVKKTVMQQKTNDVGFSNYNYRSPYDFQQRENPVAYIERYKGHDIEIYNTIRKRKPMA